MLRSIKLPAFLLLLLLGISQHAIAQSPVQTCYWTDGSTTSSTGHDFRSCNLNGPDGVSQCCDVGEVCLDNGLCFAGSKGVLYRGGCTDETWSQNTTACPKYCMAVQKWIDMVPCTPSLGPQIWCGNSSESSSCKSGNGGEVYDYTPGQALFVVNKTETAATTESVCTASGSGTAAGIACTGASDAESCVAPAVPIGVGVGVGVPLLLACLLLGWLLVRERKSRNNGHSGPSNVQDYKSYGSVMRDDRKHAEASSPAPAYAPVPLRDELEQARKMSQHRTQGVQPPSELETERRFAEMG